MLHLLATLVLGQTSSTYIQRDDYGVPHIKAPTWAQAFKAAGYAVAQDRLWQLENSRRVSRGKMAEAFGPSFVASDREVLLSGYTDEEIRAQIDALNPRLKEAWESYAQGINEYINWAKAAKRLPKPYADSGLEPEPWSTLDSAAIAIRIGQLFGRGGAGEIRNMALLGYLKTQPAKDRVLDVLDDFAWQNDPRAIPTVPSAEDPLARSFPKFFSPKRPDTERHIAQLPNANLFELLPGLRLASLEESNRVAEARNVLFKTGSYAVVVSASRSAYGWPLLLSGPQMGFTTPSIIHEMSIEAAGLSVVGLDVPGIPGVLVGHTRSIAWGLTSGVADTDDIFFSKISGSDSYSYGSETRKLVQVKRVLRVKGEEPKEVIQMRTHYGPIVVTTSGGAYFSRRSSFAGKELQGFDALAGLWDAAGPSDIAKAVERIPLTFNIFYATSKGDIGYRYGGLVPMRAPGLDPRFPTPGEPANDWKGFVPKDRMPFLLNPKSGVIANWNNKPASWWPNFDTPAWGRLFRNERLLSNLQGKLSIQSLESAAWNIARQDELGVVFQSRIISALDGVRLDEVEGSAAAYLGAFGGMNLEGSQGATIHRATVDALREELFAQHTGTFLSPDLFRIAAQPSVMLDALEGKTTERAPADYVRELFDRFQAEAKTIYPRVEEQIRRQSASLNLDSLLKGLTPS